MTVMTRVLIFCEKKKEDPCLHFVQNIKVKEYINIQHLLTQAYIRNLKSNVLVITNILHLFHD
jgi:hypothetical protein